METIDIELNRIFVKVVENGGFTNAAKVLNVPKSTISKAVSKLENLTETKLMIRSTRSFTLTAAGEAFYQQCLQPVRELEEAQRKLYGQDSLASGEIRITATDDVGVNLISPILGRLNT